MIRIIRNFPKKAPIIYGDRPVFNQDYSYRQRRGSQENDLLYWFLK